MVRVTHLGGVVVQRDLAVEGDDRAVLGADQRVHLDERGVLGREDGPELLDDVGDGGLELLGEVRGVDDLARLRLVDAHDRVDGDAGEGLGALDGELLDLHAALDGAHGEVVAVRAVQEHGEVELLGDLGALRDHHAVDRVALDVHPEDLGGLLLGLRRGVGELDAAGLATAAGLHLGLDDDGPAAELLCTRASLFGRRRDDAAEHGHAVLLEDVASLVFEQVHPAASFHRWCPWVGRGRHERMSRHQDIPEQGSPSRDTAATSRGKTPARGDRSHRPGSPVSAGGGRRSPGSGSPRRPPASPWGRGRSPASCSCRPRPGRAGPARPGRSRRT